MMAVDGRDGCGRPRTTVAAVDGNEQLLTAVDGSDGCGRMRTAVDRRGRPSMAMMLADSPGLRWRDAQGRGQVQEWRRSGHGRVLHTSSVWCYHQHATHEISAGETISIISQALIIHFRSKMFHIHSFVIPSYQNILGE